jgi:hypothetical protein
VGDGAHAQRHRGRGATAAAAADAGVLGVEPAQVGVNQRRLKAGVLVRPTMMAPASRSDRTSGESVAAMG